MDSHLAHYGSAEGLWWCMRFATPQERADARALGGTSILHLPSVTCVACLKEYVATARISINAAKGRLIELGYVLFEGDGG